MRPVTSRRRSLRARAAGWLALVVCGALALTGCGSIYDLPLPGGADTGSNPVTVHVIFRDVLDLVPQSTVKVDDVTVGKVTAVKLKGYTADVTLKLNHSVDLPDNARAEIRQTSLLGEKFVSLEEPSHPSSGKLGDGDTIGLADTGRNPEVEEVLGALAALLNGGGVAQLKSIAGELNTAVGGREADVRSVLDQLHYFMGQLAQNKTAVVGALDHVNRLAKALRAQDSTIRATLDRIPAALASVNKQRSDLVKMLSALSRLSNVGVKVIKASKEATIDSLQDLAPVLTQLAKAGQSLPKSLQIALTYPFLDAAVGNNPQVARNLHMGDYVNLKISLDLDLLHLTIPGLPGAPTLQSLLRICDNTPLASVCSNPAAKQLVNLACGLLKGTPLCDATDSATAGAPRKSASGSGAGGSSGSGGLTGLGDALTGKSGAGGGLIGGLLGGNGRAEPNAAFRKHADRDLTASQRNGVGVSALLLQGVMG